MSTPPPVQSQSQGLKSPAVLAACSHLGIAAQDLAAYDKHMLMNAFGARLSSLAEQLSSHKSALKESHKREGSLLQKLRLQRSILAEVEAEKDVAAQRYEQSVENLQGSVRILTFKLDAAIRDSAEALEASRQHAAASAAAAKLAGQLSRFGHNDNEVQNQGRAQPTVGESVDVERVLQAAMAKIAHAEAELARMANAAEESSQREAFLTAEIYALEQEHCVRTKQAAKLQDQVAQLLRQIEEAERSCQVASERAERHAAAAAAAVTAAQRFRLVPEVDALQDGQCDVAGCINQLASELESALQRAQSAEYALKAANSRVQLHTGHTLWLSRLQMAEQCLSEAINARETGEVLQGGEQACSAPDNRITNRGSAASTPDSSLRLGRLCPPTPPEQQGGCKVWLKAGVDADDDATTEIPPDALLGLELGRLSEENTMLRARLKGMEEELMRTKDLLGHSNPAQKLQYHRKLKQQLEATRAEASSSLLERFALEQCVRYLAVRARLPVAVQGGVSGQGPRDALDVLRPKALAGALDGQPGSRSMNVRTPAQVEADILEKIEDMFHRTKQNRAGGDQHHGGQPVDQFGRK